MKAVSQVNSIKKTLERQNSNQIKVKLVQPTEPDHQGNRNGLFNSANKREKQESTSVNDFDKQSDQVSDDELSVDLSEISR